VVHIEVVGLRAGDFRLPAVTDLLKAMLHIVDLRPEDAVD
jgi:hypothetical protein